MPANFARKVTAATASAAVAGARPCSNSHPKIDGEGGIGGGIESAPGVELA